MCSSDLFYAQEFFYGHMPAKVINRRRAVVEPVSQSSNLSKISPFGDFLKCTVDITYGLLGVEDFLAIHREDILENPVRSRVCRPEIEGIELPINLLINIVV